MISDHDFIREGALQISRDEIIRIRAISEDQLKPHLLPMNRATQLDYLQEIIDRAKRATSARTWQSATRPGQNTESGRDTTKNTADLAK